MICFLLFSNLFDLFSSIFLNIAYSLLLLEKSNHISMYILVELKKNNIHKYIRGQKCLNHE